MHCPPFWQILTLAGHAVIGLIEFGVVVVVVVVKVIDDISQRDPK